MLQIAGGGTIDRFAFDGTKPTCAATRLAFCLSSDENALAGCIDCSDGAGSGCCVVCGYAGSERVLIDDDGALVHQGKVWELGKELGLAVGEIRRRVRFAAATILGSCAERVDEWLEHDSSGAASRSAHPAGAAATTRAARQSSCPRRASGPRGSASGRRTTGSGASGPASAGQAAGTSRAPIRRRTADSGARSPTFAGQAPGSRYPSCRRQATGSSHASCRRHAAGSLTSCPASINDRGVAAGCRRPAGRARPSRPLTAVDEFTAWNVEASLWPGRFQ